MQSFGYLRPYGNISSDASIYGNNEGIYFKSNSYQNINNVILTYKIRTIGHVDAINNPRTYKFSIGYSIDNEINQNNFIEKNSQVITNPIENATIYSIGFYNLL